MRVDTGKLYTVVTVLQYTIRSIYEHKMTGKVPRYGLSNKRHNKRRNKKNE